MRVFIGVDGYIPITICGFLECDFLKYPNRVEVDFNGLTLNLMEKEVRQLLNEHLQIIRNYDKMKKIRNSISIRKNQIFLLKQFARYIKKPFNKMVEDNI